MTATTHPQTVRLYFNLEGIKTGKTSHRDFIYNRSGRQIGGDPFAGGSATAWELYQIQHTGLCSKTMFFENGSTSLVPSPQAKAEICAGY